jgi:hypothetical protein
MKRCQIDPETKMASSLSKKQSCALWDFVLSKFSIAIANFSLT